MASKRPEIGPLAEELRKLRAAGRVPLAVEKLVLEGALPGLLKLTIVRDRMRISTSLDQAEAIIEVVQQAVSQLPEVRDGHLARLLFCTHQLTATKRPGPARVMAQEASGVLMRQWRKKQEPGILRLVAHEVLILEHNKVSRRVAS